ncbi:MAG: cation:proton antiporter [Chloroflexota bacterium]
METNPTIQLFLALGIIVFMAKSAGYVSRLLGQPAVLGELIAGIILGPSVLNMLGWSVFTDQHLSEMVIHIAELGVLLLMFNAGLEIDLVSLRRVQNVALSAGTLGVVFPLLLAVPVALVSNYSLEAALFIGMSMAATSVSISAQTMVELGVLQTKEGIALLGAAVIDDVLAILLLSVLIALSLAGGGGLGDVIGVVLRITIYIAAALGIGWLLLPRIANWIANRPISSGVLAFSIVAALLFGWSAELFGGIAAITGAFIAGVCLSRADKKIRHQIDEGLHEINYGLLVPVFFISIGLRTNLRDLDSSHIPFTIALLATAIASKIIGSGLGARLTGFDNQSALRVGVGMVSRGEVGLIIATVGLQAGVIPASIFPAIVLVTLATTVVTPPLVRWAFREPKSAPAVSLTYDKE